MNGFRLLALAAILLAGCDVSIEGQHQPSAYTLPPDFMEQVGQQPPEATQDAPNQPQVFRAKPIGDESEGDAVATPTTIHGQSVQRSFSGEVVGVYDGDSITVLDENNEQVRVRLAAIDTPERGQPFGNNAKNALSKLVFGKNINVIVVDVDRYGRTVAFVFVDGIDVNAVLVFGGMAWEYKQYSKSELLGQYQQDAISNRRGLWAGQGPDDQVPPWEWRRR